MFIFTHFEIHFNDNEYYTFLILYIAVWDEDTCIFLQMSSKKFDPINWFYGFFICKTGILNENKGNHMI